MDCRYDLMNFHRSTTNELMAARNRVRYLIPNPNWGEEGRYKEAILRNMIKKFIPQRYIVGSGFIVDDHLENSGQIDILIFDSNYPTLVAQDDFYVVNPDGVRAVIEVKTNVQNQKLSAAVDQINKIGSFLDRARESDSMPFVGLFSFEGYSNARESTIKNHILRGIGDKCFVNHISLNQNIFIKLWQSELFEEDYLSVYNLVDLSFSFFISNLVKFLSDGMTGNELPTWFATDKERHQLFDIDIPSR
jgi:hypothetical protein